MNVCPKCMMGVVKVEHLPGTTYYTCTGCGWQWSQNYIPRLYPPERTGISMGDWQQKKRRVR